MATQLSDGAQPCRWRLPGGGSGSGQRAAGREGRVQSGGGGGGQRGDSHAEGAGAMGGVANAGGFGDANDCQSGVEPRAAARAVYKTAEPEERCPRERGVPTQAQLAADGAEITKAAVPLACSGAQMSHPARRV